METYTQAKRVLEISTPLGRDDLLLVGFKGHEGLSELFHFHLDLLALRNKNIPFEALLGQAVLIRVSPPSGKKRLIAGIIRRMAQAGQGPIFTRYRAEVVPQVWLLSKRVQSRIFQHIAVPDILKTVFTGQNVTFQIQGNFHPRDYCVQYRESDFAFASRLMEEEGIYYFFKHSAAGHQLVIANDAASHPTVPDQPTLVYDDTRGGRRDELRVNAWEKAQGLVPGKVTLWDHCFEMPDKHLEVEKTIQKNVKVGQIVHPLSVPATTDLEVYDYPGLYAQRFDGVDRGGAPTPAELQNIFQDNQRTAQIRMQEEAAAAVSVEGRSDSYFLTAGHKFTLLRHFNAEGDYVLTRVEHEATLGADYRSGGEGDEVKYTNHFTCIPLGLPFRPARVTPRPRMDGAQTAVVVGPPGEEIYVDKYGRVKVQFPWDRQGKHDLDSSCWVRVSAPWAGQHWGAIQHPRIGQEVIVDFLEGDPDRPIVTGRVYNAQQVPPFDLPASKAISGVKSNSTLGGGGYNEFSFDDTKGKEKIVTHAQHDMTTTVLHDQTLTVQNDQTVTVVGECDVLIKKDQREQVNGTHHITVQGDRNEKVVGTVSLEAQGIQTLVGADYALEGGQEVHIKAGQKLVLEAGLEVTLKAAGGFIKIDASGVTVVGTPLVKINSGGAPGVGKDCTTVEPKAPRQAAAPAST